MTDTNTDHSTSEALSPVFRHPYVLLNCNPNKNGRYTQKTGRQADVADYKEGFYVESWSFNQKHKDFIGLGTVGPIWRYEKDPCPGPKPWGHIAAIMAFVEEPYYQKQDDEWYANGVLYRLPDHQWIKGEDLYADGWNQGSPCPSPVTRGRTPTFEGGKELEVHNMLLIEARLPTELVTWIHAHLRTALI